MMPGSMNRSLIINSLYTEPNSHWEFMEEGAPPLTQTSPSA